MITDVFNLLFTFRRFYRNYILPGYVDDCLLLAFGAVQGEVFKHRIGAHFNSVFVVGNRV